MSQRFGFTPASPQQSFRGSVEEAVTGAIVSGQMAPGLLVTVPTLAEEFGVSATPVREALVALQRQHFLEPVRNKGFRVTEVSRQDVEGLAQVRMLLEPPAVRHIASESISADAIVHLKKLADRIIEAAAQSELARYVLADIDFHEAVVSLAGNRVLTETVTNLRRRTRLSGLLELINTKELAESAHEHRELVDLLEKGDADEAEQLMKRHIRHVVGWWSGNPEVPARADAEASAAHN